MFTLLKQLQPISLTCILCTNIEHILSSSITKYLSKLNIFYELQHGFREKCSCTNPSSSCWSMIFYKVSHEKLALELHGIRGALKGFFDNRHQSVIVNGSSSEPIPVSSGVPQWGLCWDHISS